MGIQKPRDERDFAYPRQLFWAIRTIHSHLEEIHVAWAKLFGVTTPQLMILFALADFDDRRTGLPVKQVAKILYVDSTFITTQSKLLEGRGFVSRVASDEDARVVRLSLTEKSLRQLADLSMRQKTINGYVFSQFSDHDMRELAASMFALKTGMEKASAIASLDLDR